MSAQTPYARLVGTWKFWIAPVGTAKPDLDAAPAGDWVALGATDGDQTFRIMGEYTDFKDNESTAPRKHIRPEEGVEVVASLVNLTLEDKAYIRSMAATAVVTASSGALNVKRLSNKRGFSPTRYSLLARGGAIESNTMSPYGAWPAQLWIPQGVFDGESEEVYAKDGSPAVEFTYRAEHDSTQAAGYELGYLEVQSS